MRKLELKDIIGYLPYDLPYWTPEIKSNGVLSFDNIRGILADVLYPDAEVHVYKPYFLLRPMSDLIKPIIVKGYNDDKEFVPIQYLYDICSTPPNGYNPSDFIDESDEIWSFTDLVEAFDYDKILVCIDLLNQWHMDYRNLIAEGLAIDINTLNQ